MDSDLEGLIEMTSAKEAAIGIQLPLFPEMVMPREVQPPAPPEPRRVKPGPLLPIFRENRFNSTGGYIGRREDFTDDEWSRARKAYNFLFGTGCPNKDTYRDQYTREIKISFQSFFDPTLSRLCRKGEPRHVSDPQWEDDLNAKSWKDFHLPKITVLDVATHLNSSRPDASMVPSRIYVVANLNRNSTRGMIVLDFDDKKGTGRVKELLQRLDAAFPNIRSGAYTECSPGGSGAHVLVLVDIGGLSHHQANDLLSAMSTRIKVTVNRPDDPKGLDFDSVKATFPWVEWQGRGPTAKMIHKQGTFGSMPMPRNEDDLTQLKNLKCHDLTALANMVLGGNQTPTTNESTPNEPMIHGAMTHQTPSPPTTAHNDPTTIVAPHSPLPSLPISTCIGQTAITPRVQLQDIATIPSIHNTCIKKPSSPRYVKGSYDTIEGIRALKDPLERKRGLVFRMTWDRGYPVLESEAKGMAELYVLHKLNDTDPPDMPQLIKQFVCVIRYVANGWDAQLAFGRGPASSMFDFVNDLDVPAHFAPLLKKRTTPKSIVETMRVVLFLAFEVHEPERDKEETELEHQCRIDQYRFTLGGKRIRKYIIRARKRGAKWTASIDQNVISACLGAAVRLGWLYKLQTFSQGSFCTRYMPGRSNRTQWAFLAKHRAEVKRFDPEMRAFEGWPSDDHTLLSVSCLNAAQAHAESDWPTPVQPAAPTEPWTPVMAPGCRQGPSAGAPAVTPFFDSSGGQFVEEDDFDMDPPGDEYDPSADQLAYDYDDSADQPVDECIVCA